MTNFRNIAAALTTFVALVSAVPAFAGTHWIDGRSTEVITFYACGDFHLSAIGDGDTDLDFKLYNPRGRLVHEDDDGTDITFADIDAGCGTFRLEVRNWGRLSNLLDVLVLN